MNELENTSLDYPKMIYDGPFSDGLENRQVKGLKGADVTKEQALKNFKTLFANYAIKQAEVLNECNGDIPTYNIQALTEKDENIYAQMTKQGGKLIMFNCYEPCDKEILTIEECREIAEVFVKKAGFDNMKPVWQTSSRAVCQFNFAYEQDGVIVYSDLVKVNVCMERGLVSAVEASTYYYNHTEREIGEVRISSSVAKEKVCSALDVQSVRKAIVPVGNGKERLAYEVCAECEGDMYYIYIDAISGEEVEIFKVVNSKEGRLLI
jgi:germination protein YpeB